MPFNGTTYSEISTAAAQVNGLVAEKSRRLTTTKGMFSQIVTELTELATEYGPIVPAIDVLLAANPDNQAIQVLKGHITQLLADFTAVQSAAGAIDALVNTP